jgi:hypothetical protein
MQFIFGTGSLFGTALTDAQGNAIATPSPVKFGELQDVSIDMSRDIKPLYGQNMMPVAIGGGKMKFDFKSKFARLNGRIFNDLFFGQSLNAGTLQGVYNDTTGAAIPGTPYAVTPTVPSSGTWARDLGVIDSNGVPMKRVASAPATGEYMVSAGVYTFAAADTTKTVFISFAYTASVAAARQVSFTNQPMGYVPTFGIDLAILYNGKPANMRFNQCVSGKLGFSPKQDDFGVADMDFSAFADGSGTIGYIQLAE